MRVKSILPVLIGVVCLGATAQAQTPGLKPKIYIGGGVNSVVNPNDFKDITKSGVTFLGAVGLPFTPGIEVIAKFHYHDLGFASQFVDLGIPDLNMKVTTIGADVKFPFGPGTLPVRPYLFLGGGTFSFSADSASKTVGSTTYTFPATDESDIYFNIGAGVDVKLGPAFALFAEAKYTMLKTSGETSALLPIVVGLKVL